MFLRFIDFPKSPAWWETNVLRYSSKIFQLKNYSFTLIAKNDELWCHLKITVSNTTIPFYI